MPTAVDPDDLLLTVAGDSLRELTTVDQLADALACRGVTLPATLRPLLARDQARSDVEQAAKRAAGARRRTTSAAASSPPHRHGDWAWMVTADGFRAQLHTRPAALWSRAGNDLLPAFADAVDAALADLPDVDAVPDCELVVLDDTARPDFTALSESRRFPQRHGRPPGSCRRAGAPARLRRTNSAWRASSPSTGTPPTPAGARTGGSRSSTRTRGWTWPRAG